MKAEDSEFSRKRQFHHLSYLHNPGTEPLRPLTLGKLLEQTADKYGDREAIVSVFQNQSLTFNEVLKQADKLAAGLKVIGLNVGDRVGLWAPNLTEWYVTHMACARGGYILVNINPAYRPLEMKYCINKVGVKSIVCTHEFKSQNYYDILNEISPEISKCEPERLMCKEMPTLKSIIVTNASNLRGTFNYEDIIELATPAEIERIRNLQNFIDPDDICHIQFTSGTTGEPKAPVQTHFHIVNNAYYIGKRTELDRKHHRICVQNPFFHAFGTNITINAALNHGATLVVPTPGYSPEKSLDAIRDKKCTVIQGTPTMYVDLVNIQKRRKENISPEIALTGGASCSPHLFNEMKEVLRVKKVKIALSRDNANNNANKGVILVVMAGICLFCLVLIQQKRDKCKIRRICKKTKKHEKMQNEDDGIPAAIFAEAQEATTELQFLKSGDHYEKLFAEYNEWTDERTRSVYGLTETTAVVFQSLFDDDEYQSTATVGYVGDHLEVKVIDEEGKIVPRGKPGELLVRGYNTTLGYWQDEEKTRELIGPDKWLRTGDKFILEENGYGKLIGRIKEIIIRGGENIFPREIEDFLNTHPSILETHVVGIPHERLGEEVCACVRVKENATLTIDDVKLYCKDKIAIYKIPSSLIVVETFPKTTSGKIQKYKIIESLTKKYHHV